MPRPAPIEAVAKHLQAALDAAKTARNPELTRKIKAAIDVAEADRRCGKVREGNMLARLPGPCPRLSHALESLLKAPAT